MEAAGAHPEGCRQPEGGKNVHQEPHEDHELRPVQQVQVPLQDLDDGP